MPFCFFPSLSATELGWVYLMVLLVSPGINYMSAAIWYLDCLNHTWQIGWAVELLPGPWKLVPPLYILV
jgi:hypothetical protein